MMKPSIKPGAMQTTAKNANLKGDRLTSKHGKAMAHKATERRMSSKGRGR